MGRRPLAVGDYGSISFATLGTRKVQAKCKVRDTDGVIRKVAREGTSKADARVRLLEALAERPGFSGAAITADSTISDTATSWLTEVERKVAEGTAAPNTARLYRSAWENHVQPGVGALRLREATVPRLDAFVVGMRERHEAAITKTSRTVLNGVMSYAVRQGALPANPMREVSRVAGGRRRVPRALTPAERDAWLDAMERDEVAAHRDLPDITRWMLATGCRIGEALAVTFDEIDVDDKTVSIDWTLDRVKGAGLQRKSTKTAAGERTLRLPGWAVDLVIRRGDRHGWSGPLFPVPGRRKGEHRWPTGLWRDPSNTSRDLREARERAGFGWVTSHVFRKTTATVMSESGMTDREIAAQLGHANLRTVDVYIARRAVGDHAATALEEMWGPNQKGDRGESGS